MTEIGPLVENFNVGHQINAVTFTTTGQYIISGGREGVRVSRAQDGKRMATMKAWEVYCLAVSKDGRWIAAGTYLGYVLVWDAHTYERVFSHRGNPHIITGVDFSPDSTRLVAASDTRTATVWEVETCRRVRTLHHRNGVVAAKYSLQGDRIATATFGESVRIWDSNGGDLLLDIPMQVTTEYNTGLLWLNSHLLVVSNNEIQKIDASTGSIVSEWPVPDTEYASCIALPRHEAFIVYATRRTVTFLDTSTRAQFDLLPELQDIYSIALSPDDRYLAIAGESGKITVKCVFSITDPMPSSHLHHTFKEPEICIDSAALEAWKRDQLADAEALLTAAIPQSHDTRCHVLASRALVQTRLRKWDAAIIDAEESINIQPSIIAYIAKCMALVGKGKRHEGYQACDIAFEHFHSAHVTILLLLKAVVVFMDGEHDDAISRVDNLISAVFFNSAFYVVLARAYMHLLLGNSHMESDDYERAIRSFKHARAQLHNRTSRPPLMISLISGWKFDNLNITIQRRLCEAFHAAGRAKEAGEAILETVNDLDEEIHICGPIAEWATDFMQRCLSTPEGSDTSWVAARHDDMQALRLTLYLPSPTPLLRAWARLKLIRVSWKEALAAAVDFMFPRFIIYLVICESLEMSNHVADAVSCFHQMNSQLVQEIRDEQSNWILDFELRCRGKLEGLGDTAMNVQHYDEAIFNYSAALSLNPTIPQALFVRRSKARAARGIWEGALDDANEVIKLDPSCPLGYERKHEALHGARRYGDAIDAFETMLSKILQSSDPETCVRFRQYVEPMQTKKAIRAAIENAIRESPLMLINTNSGFLLDKSGQASSFESRPIFGELISSMTTSIDHARIRHEVAQYYRYAMLSHKWEDNEPLFEKVMRVAVYDLEESPTHNKLQMFCKTIRDAGVNWAWSDTCCINKGDHFILQEALVSMFKWYRGSALTIIFLRGVHSLSRRGALAKSVWNTRAWTLQEYHASKVVRFYTESWTPYMNLGIPNHKESPEIISEMEKATGVSAQALMELRPGLDDIREKLRLASTRQTTRVEDAAYSLLGIFSVSLPVIYGEGDQALGRLLAQLLMSSGDVSILAWTGRSGFFNSCLPASIDVFSQFTTSHIPLAIINTKTDTIAAGLRASSLNLPLVTKLYDRLNELPVPLFAGHRMKLPCFTFKLGRVVASRNGSKRVFRAQTTVLGVVEITAEEDLSRLDTLYLIHPWIDFLLDRHPIGSIAETTPAEIIDDQSSMLGELLSFRGPSNITSAVPQTRAARIVARLGRPFGARPNASARDIASLPPPSSMSPVEKQMRILQLVARLRQPFGALLLTPIRQHVEEYRRVAAESLITVRVEEITSTTLDKLVHSVRTLDVL